MQIAIAMILHPNDATMLIARRRSDAHLGGLWEFPGGKCEPGESLQECVLREVLEEVGLYVAIAEAWPPIDQGYGDRHVTLFPFLCRADSSDAQPLGNAEVRWVPIQELNDFPFPEANTSLIARLQNDYVGESGQFSNNI